MAIEMSGSREIDSSYSYKLLEITGLGTHEMFCGSWETTSTMAHTSRVVPRQLRCRFGEEGLRRLVRAVGNSAPGRDCAGIVVDHDTSPLRGRGFVVVIVVIHATSPLRGRGFVVVIVVIHATFPLPGRGFVVVIVVIPGR